MGRHSSKKSGVYSNEGYPGCIRGIMHLFDFHQALAGRRLLPDGNYDNDLEVSRKSLDATSGTTESPKTSASKTDEVLACSLFLQFGIETHKPAVPNVSSGMPIKALIAQELSNKVEQKNQAPNVVARLMGLDALPIDAKGLQKPTKLMSAKKSTQMSESERHRNEQRPLGNSKRNSKKVNNLIAQSIQESSGLKNHQQYGEYSHKKSGVEVLSHQDHSEEKQLQELKKEYEGRHSQRSRDHTRPVWTEDFDSQLAAKHILVCEQQLQELKKEYEARYGQKPREHPRAISAEDFDIQLAAKHILVCEKLAEAKMALTREQLSGTMHTGTRENLHKTLHESKKFLDSMDFSESRKKVFQKLLQDPSALFARHPQGNQLHLKPSSQPVHLQRDKQEHKVQDSGFYGLESRRSCDGELNSWQDLPLDLRLDSSIVNSPPVPLLYRGASLHLQDQERNVATLDGDHRNHITECQVPTRIVILKPTSEKVRNLNLSPSSSPRSPSSLRDSRQISGGNSSDVLQALREKLVKGSRENKKEERRHSRQNFYDHFRERSRDPREIAREIARQVRESVTRDLLIDSGRIRNIQSTFYPLAGDRTPQRPGTVLKATAGNTGEASTPNRRDIQNWSSASTLILPRQKKPFEAQHITSTKEGRRRQKEMFKVFSAEQADVQQPQMQNSPLRKSRLVEDNRQVFQHFDGKSGCKGHGKDNLGKINGDPLDQEVHLNDNSAAKSDRSFNSAPVCDLGGSRNIASLQIGQEGKDSSLRTAPRSQSFPAMSVIMDESCEDDRIGRPEVGTSHLCEEDMDKARTSPVKSNRMRSNISKKVSGLQGSFPLGQKKAVSSNPNNQVLMVYDGASILEDAPPIACGHLKGTDSEISAGYDSVSILSNTWFTAECALDTQIPSVEDSQVSHYKDCSRDTYMGNTDKHTKATDLKQEMVYGDHKQQCDDVIRVVTQPNLSQGSVGSPPKVCSLPNETRETVEVSKEKLEQPSPVSVLDCRFQEEVSSPVNFNDICSDLQELRLRIRLLKNDANETMEQDLASVCDEDSCMTEDRTTKDADECSSTSFEFKMTTGSVFPVNTSDCLNFGNIGIEFPAGKVPEMLYIKDILLASGFTGNGALIFARWYGPSHPLDPQLFQRMEEFYCSSQSTTAKHSEANNKAQGLLDSPSRHLLFDCVNGILHEILGPYLNKHHWVKPSNSSVCSMPTESQLFKLTFIEVARLLCLRSESQDTLGKLVAEDLAKGGLWMGLWMDLTEDIEMVGLELERSIFNDLIEEIIGNAVTQ